MDFPELKKMDVIIGRPGQGTYQSYHRIPGGESPSKTKKWIQGKSSHTGHIELEALNSKQRQSGLELTLRYLVGHARCRGSTSKTPLQCQRVVTIQRVTISF